MSGRGSVEVDGGCGIDGGGGGQDGAMSPRASKGKRQDSLFGQQGEREREVSGASGGCVEEELSDAMNRAGFARREGGSMDDLAVMNKEATERRISDAQLPPDARGEKKKTSSSHASRRPIALTRLTGSVAQSAAPLSPRGALMNRKEQTNRSSGQFGSKRLSSSSSSALSPSAKPLSPGAKPPMSPRGSNSGTPQSLSKKEERNFISKVLQL
mmetsp:Transcript_10211/g.21399  ORF Transcript_10211/g.21399 Transcript_10211/m.21399 type:complete len:213 (+) Transcript_10211:389-1027(+)|eukprot:CAMPEP_0185846424 /NCGR_PEP_ID=MMETSP1354-20130828/2065_1 /TAXON_ID=708628 /ORGANISM="Erythrolobus madagascarensis, Strain CCMP3276" /LENGTH=212 /DNA_ID=CAMNT_0028546555 /DNA_START=360 /DNA_END=998 /DNA_ORIENTATION=-